jgi:PASTA domain
VTLHSVLKAVPGPFLNVSGTCTYGSAIDPIAMHLATTADSVWKLPGRNFTIYDTAYAIPPPVCDDATLQSLVVNGAGDTSAGHNSAAMVGTAARPEDAPPPPDLGGGSPSGGGSPPPSGSSPSSPPAGNRDQTATPQTNTQNAIARRCTVPKLKGRTLAAAKRALRRAGCRVGTVSKRRSSRRRGTVLAQSKAAGRRLPAGARVALTIARR